MSGHAYSAYCDCRLCAKTAAACAALNAIGVACTNAIAAHYAVWLRHYLLPTAPALVRVASSRYPADPGARRGV